MPCYVILETRDQSDKQQYILIRYPISKELLKGLHMLCSSGARNCIIQLHYDDVVLLPPDDPVLSGKQALSLATFHNAKPKPENLVQYSLDISTLFDVSPIPVALAHLVA